MHKVLAGAIALAAITAIAGTAQAAKDVCVWTGVDWACGDGDVYSQHYSQAQGPNIAIIPQQTVVMPAKPPGSF